MVKTELWDKLGHSKEKQEEIFESNTHRLPVGFVATPEHVAEAYLYAVRADYANGTTIVIGEFPVFRSFCVSVLVGKHGESE